MPDAFTYIMTETGDNLEERLRYKLENGEITQKEYDELFAKFEKLGILKKSPKKENTSKSQTGSTTIKGGKVNGSVNINGRGIVEGSLECNRLSISGTGTVKGDLTVIGKSSITGLLQVEGNAKFVDKMALSGSLEIEENMYSLQSTSLSGRTRINGDLICDQKCLISGKFSAMNLKSTGLVRIEGKTAIDGDIIAEKFQCESGKISVGGSVRAKSVYIFSHFAEGQTEMSDSEPGESIGDLVSNVVNVIFPSLLKTVTGIFDTKPYVFSVSNDVEGTEIILSNCTVNGNVIGDKVLIGPNVIVSGKILYRSSVKVPPGSSFTLVKVE